MFLKIDKLTAEDNLFLKADYMQHLVFTNGVQSLSLPVYCDAHH
jgi:hypothetical protein